MDESTAKKLELELSSSNGFESSVHSSGHFFKLLNGSWVSTRVCQNSGEWLVLVSWTKKIVAKLGPNSFGGNREFYTPDGIQNYIDERKSTLAN